MCHSWFLFLLHVPYIITFLLWNTCTPDHCIWDLQSTFKITTFKNTMFILHKLVFPNMLLISTQYGWLFATDILYIILVFTVTYYSWMCWPYLTHKFRNKMYVEFCNSTAGFLHQLVRNITQLTGFVWN